MRFPTMEYSGNIGIVWRKQYGRKLSKRLLDIVIALGLLILLLPALAVIALLVRLDSPGPAFFRQTRVGKQTEPDDRLPGGEPDGYNTFTFYKFRSMRMQSGDTPHREFVEKFINGEVRPEENGGGVAYKLVKDDRVTRVGRILRCTSLDELPQLINVLKGNMSLVGPRPPLPYEVAMYKSHHLRRLEVLPGITGLWQVRGRSKVTFDEMVDMDIEYIDNWSLRTDLRILALTLPAIIRRDGAA